MSLEIRNVTKRFNENAPVLDDLSLSLESGKFSGLLGPSGCGKTTLLRIIAGLEEATKGSVVADGDTLVDTERGVQVPPEKRNIGMVFQNYAVWPHMSVFENIAFPLRIRRRPKAEIRDEVMEAVKKVRLDGLEARRPQELSGGQQQRVALARALIQKPRLLLLDEPLSNLDAHLRATMRTEIRRIQENLKITAVIVTHDWKDAQDLCDRIAILRGGRLEQAGSPSEIAANPASDFVKGLL